MSEDEKIGVDLEKLIVSISEFCEKQVPTSRRLAEDVVDFLEELEETLEEVKSDQEEAKEDVQEAEEEKKKEEKEKEKEKDKKEEIAGLIQEILDREPDARLRPVFEKLVELVKFSSHDGLTIASLIRGIP
jgi:chromosome segregation ATPase